MIKANWPLKLDVSDSVDVWVDHYNPVMTKPRIVIVSEPTGRCNAAILSRPTGYTYLFTYFEELLSLPRAVFHNPVTPFVDPAPDLTKRFSVSNIITNRCNNPQHYLRRELWHRRDEITIPHDFYMSGSNPYLEGGEAELVLDSAGKSKVKVFDNMFHVCILTSSKGNYIDEKLVDCLLTKTVPIFVGCENVGDFFNMDGIIVCQNVDDIIAKCNSLTELDYLNRVEAIEDNYQRALKFYPYEKAWSDKINKLLCSTKQ